MNAVAEQEGKATQTQPVQNERGYVTPGVNILETAEAYLLEAEMPGVNKNNLEINVENNVLTLVGRRPATPEGTLLYGESTQADYRRVFELDPSIETAKITAKLEQGILSLTLPKAEKAKPQRIAIN